MRIVLASVYVDDQAKALAFYTDVPGFVKKQDVRFGESRWLTVAAVIEERARALMEAEPDEKSRKKQRAAWRKATAQTARTARLLRRRRARGRGCRSPFPSFDEWGPSFEPEREPSMKITAETVVTGMNVSAG